MKRSKLTFTIAAMLLAFNSFAQEQPKPKTEEEPLQHRYVGLGIRTGIQFNDLVTNYFPTNRLVINVDANKYFRLEFQYGLYNDKSVESITYTDWSTGNTITTDVELKSHSSYTGLGLMGMYPSGRTRFICGFRYGILGYFSDNIDYSSSYPQSVRSNGKATSMSGVIGGEYFFVKCFSIGAEFAMSSISDKFTPNAGSARTDKTLLTETNLIFRFYPF